MLKNFFPEFLSLYVYSALFEVSLLQNYLNPLQILVFRPFKVAANQTVYQTCHQLLWLKIAKHAKLTEKLVMCTEKQL